MQTNTTHFQVRLEADLITAVRDFATENGLSHKEATTSLLEAGLRQSEFVATIRARIAAEPDTTAAVAFHLLNSN